MRYQINAFNGHQTAKVLAVLLSLFTLILWPIFIVTTIISFKNQPKDPMFLTMSIFFLLAPLFYLVFGYVFTRLCCWIYTMLAKKIGGIEIEVKEIHNKVI